MNRNIQTEEELHAVSHGVGTLLAVAGFFLLLHKNASGDTVLATVALSVYGMSLVLLFLASTLYHLV